MKRHDDAVEIFPDEKRWTSQGGLSGVTSSDLPLDELSFLYYLRTLPLTGDSTITLSRHFDTARNPTTVTVVGREEIEVGAGRFRAIVVEMRVRDTRRYNGEGVIRFSFSDDKCGSSSASRATCGRRQGDPGPRVVLRAQVRVHLDRREIA